MDQADKNYFLDRAEEEITQANLAIHAKVARVHYHLAAHYLDRVYGADADGAAASEGDVRSPLDASSLPARERSR